MEAAIVNNEENVNGHHTGSLLESALSLAKVGFHVFPLVPYSKTPAIDDFPNRASQDVSQIRRWWTCPITGWEQSYNIGISTSHFGEKEALLVVDVDVKEGKKGDETLLRLELEGFTFPATYRQITPTHGQHLVYRVSQAVKQSAGKLGPGIDTRSRGGYIVGAGSVLEDGMYTGDSLLGQPLAPAPNWLVERFKEEDSDEKPNTPRRPSKKATREPANTAQSTVRAIDYLTQHAPLAAEGSNGDQTTFAVAARVKDFGLDEETCLELLFERWNNRCSPPWSHEELKRKVRNAYAYGLNEVGSDSPQAHFEPLPKEDKTPEKLHPFDELNKEYAYVGGNLGFIVHFTQDENGRPISEVIDNLAKFHTNNASRTMDYGGKNVPITRLWLNSPKRRSYNGIAFMPGKKAPPGFYNRWDGFYVEPLNRLPTKREKASLDAFLEHAEKNVCRGDKTLFAYLMAWFAHLIQKPWEKPLVALVMKGKKGVGKNALIERVGHLLGASSAVVSNRRYVIGNFNSLLENKLLLTLDEAFWSGDKSADGILKDLITGKQHMIERKGYEPYPVKNCLRVAILGNEEWLVPATEDERRYCVFSVGEGRRLDNKFFVEMREGMEAGGYSLLLRFLMDYKIDLDVTTPPDTEGLADQKRQSLKSFHQWWEERLMQGSVLEQGEGWQEHVETSSLKEAFYRYLSERRMGNWHPPDSAIGRMLRECLPTVTTTQKRVDGRLARFYKLGTCEAARAAWDKFIGYPVDFGNLTEDEELLS